MKVSFVALLLLAAWAAAAPSSADLKEKENLSPFPIFHPRLPPWLRSRTTTKKPTTTTAEPSTTTEEQTTTKRRKTTTSTEEPTTKPHTTTTTESSGTTSVSSTTVLPPFRGDYTLLGNFGYYKFHKEFKRTWSEAWQGCIEEDAHLLVVRSQEEFDTLYRWMPDEMPPYVYYGAHHRYANQRFVTIFDEPLESVPYHKFGWDYSNTTFFNNKDYPVMIIDISIGWGTSGIYLNPEYREYYQFICKKDI